jgi:hypothetical protein
MSPGNKGSVQTARHRVRRIQFDKIFSVQYMYVTLVFSLESSSPGQEPKCILTPGQEPKCILTPGQEPNYILTPGQDPKYIITSGQDSKSWIS